jgi:hypothetical protein
MYYVFLLNYSVITPESLAEFGQMLIATENLGVTPSPQRKKRKISKRGRTML